MRYYPSEHSPGNSPHDVTYRVRKAPRNRPAWRPRCNVYEITPDATRRLEGGNFAHTYFVMRGEFDVYSRRQLASALEGALDSLRITIDLRGTAFMDAAILGVLVAIAARRRELRAARLRIINASAHLKRLFSICQLEDTFCFEPVRQFAMGPWGSAGLGEDR